MNIFRKTPRIWPTSFWSPGPKTECCYVEWGTVTPDDPGAINFQLLLGNFRMRRTISSKGSWRRRMKRRQHLSADWLTPSSGVHDFGPPAELLICCRA